MFPRMSDKIILACLAALAVWIVWRTTFHTPPERVADLESACVEWMETKIMPDHKARVKDTWRKSGRIVFEMVMVARGETSGMVLLCVADPDTGDLLKPGAFEMAGWRR